MLQRYQNGGKTPGKAAMPSVQAASEFSSAHKELEAIKQSRSWRITRPLRDASRLLQRLRKH
jgi:hypothetical protein